MTGPESLDSPERPDSPRFGASLDVRFAESVEAFAEFVATRGLDHVELRHGYLDVRGSPDAAELRAIADRHGVTYTVHAPHVDCTPGNLNETHREAFVSGVKSSLEFAAAIDAGGVVVHGGATRRRYPDRVNRHAREQAVTSLRECARYAAEVGVPLCLENQRETESKRRNTATPDRLESFLGDVGVGPESLRLTLDVGHAKATGLDHGAFVDRFGERIHVVHLHDNDGTDDDHDPLSSFREVASDIGAPYNVLEMKSLADIDRCLDSGAGDTTP
jgi:sugar phosphate isomerase/epimerase